MAAFCDGRISYGRISDGCISDGRISDEWITVSDARVCTRDSDTRSFTVMHATLQMLSHISCPAANIQSNRTLALSPGVWRRRNHNSRIFIIE